MVPRNIISKIGTPYSAHRHAGYSQLCPAISRELQRAIGNNTPLNRQMTPLHPHETPRDRHNTPLNGQHGRDEPVSDHLSPHVFDVAGAREEVAVLVEGKGHDAVRRVESFLLVEEKKNTPTPRDTQGNRKYRHTRDVKGQRERENPVFVPRDFTGTKIADSRRYHRLNRHYRGTAAVYRRRLPLKKPSEGTHSQNMNPRFFP